MASKPTVLFVCTHNAGRSQMAAGWLERLGGSRVRVYSAGSEPSDVLNPVAVAVMAERGIDIGRNTPRIWTNPMVRQADVIVTMGCGDVCPVYSGKRYTEWDLPDPSGRPAREVRLISDAIEARVLDLLADLDGFHT